MIKHKIRAKCFTFAERTARNAGARLQIAEQFDRGVQRGVVRIQENGMLRDISTRQFVESCGCRPGLNTTARLIIVFEWQIVTILFNI